jgi:dihydroxy-acid dehydratase
MLTAHAFDAVVFIPSCDKVVPGMLLAAARMNLPSIFIGGGPMLPASSQEKHRFEQCFLKLYGAHSSGKNE